MGEQGGSDDRPTIGRREPRAQRAHRGGGAALPLSKNVEMVETHRVPGDFATGFARAGSRATVF
jgi:hypothetical protein